MSKRAADQEGSFQGIREALHDPKRFGTKTVRGYLEREKKTHIQHGSLSVEFFQLRLGLALFSGDIKDRFIISQRDSIKIKILSLLAATATNLIQITTL